MKKVGDYDWRQVSMWGTTPQNCIETYITVETGLSGKHVCQFYLQRIKEIVSDNHWKVETVESLEGIPADVLNWQNGDYRLKVDSKGK
jgi:hypothetical protein